MQKNCDMMRQGVRLSFCEETSWFVDKYICFEQGRRKHGAAGAAAPLPWLYGSSGGSIVPL